MLELEEYLHLFLIEIEKKTSLSRSREKMHPWDHFPSSLPKATDWRDELVKNLHESREERVDLAEQKPEERATEL